MVAVARARTPSSPAGSGGPCGARARTPGRLPPGERGGAGERHTEGGNSHSSVSYSFLYAGSDLAGYIHQVCTYLRNNNANHRPPCGKSPTKDRRACKILRIILSALKTNSLLFCCFVELVVFLYWLSSFVYVNVELTIHWRRRARATAAEAIPNMLYIKCACMYVCMYIYIYTYYMCMYKHMCIYIYI